MNSRRLLRSWPSRLASLAGPGRRRRVDARLQDPARDAGRHRARRRAVKDAAGIARVVAADAFLQIERGGEASRAPATAGGFMLHMTGGDRVGGEPVAMEDQLVWKNPGVGELRVPCRARRRHQARPPRPRGTADGGRGHARQATPSTASSRRRRGARRREVRDGRHRAGADRLDRKHQLRRHARRRRRPPAVPPPGATACARRRLDDRRARALIAEARRRSSHADARQGRRPPPAGGTRWSRSSR